MAKGKAPSHDGIPIKTNQHPALENDFFLAMSRYYRDVEIDSTFVTRCLVNFTPFAMHQHHLSLPIYEKCYKVGTYSRCHNEWEKPIGLGREYMTYSNESKPYLGKNS